jgi:glycerophosphoryl diester phosphodiesterase
MKVVSHRCNTLEQFKEAITQDIYGIEIDVHEVNDKFIVSHEPPIHETLKLNTLIKLIKNSNKILFLEIKGRIKNILELKKKIKDTPVIIMSFNFVLLQEFRDFSRMFITANIFNEIFLNLILQENFDYICLDYIIAYEDYIKKLNKPIFVYTVNTKEHFDKIKKLIFGVITDTPNDL